MRYKLIWEEVFHEGSEINTETYESEAELHARANEILIKEDIDIIFSGEVITEYYYEPEKHVIRYKPKTK